MGRNFDAETLSASKESTVFPVYLVKLNFDTPVYVHSDYGDIVYDGNTYVGVGDLGQIDPVNENNEMRVESVNLTLSGVNNAIVSEIISTSYQGKKAEIFIGFRDMDSNELLAPKRIFNGLIDNTKYDMSEQVIITVTCTRVFTSWERSEYQRYNHATQQFFYHGDLGFEYQDELKTKEIYWGGPTPE